MTSGTLEHVNFTVSNPLETAALMQKLFGWGIRWQGESLGGGFTVHVGNDDTYLALYSGPDGKQATAQDNYAQLGGLNHIGVIVPDLDAVEALVKSAGFVPENHADYEPGRRFYFKDNDGIEYEIVSYH